MMLSRPDRLISLNGITVSSFVWMVLAIGSSTGFFKLDLIEKLFLFAPLVIVPMGLALLLADSPESAGFLPPAIKMLWPAAASLAVVAFCIQQGLVSASLCSVWFLFSCLVCFRGVDVCLRRGFRSLADACFFTAQAYLPVGAAWLLLSRWGATPMGFAEPIVLLTAVHFHFAGFAAAILAGATTRHVASTQGRTPMTLRAASGGIVIAPAFVATGFVFSRTLQLLAVLIFALCLVLLSWHVISFLPRIRSRIVRFLLLVSAGSVPVSMIFAVIYTIGDVQGQLFVSIPNMAAIHGTLNAFGFCFCGLLAWTLQMRKP